MTGSMRLIFVLVALAASLPATRAAGVDSLKILYLGGVDERAQQFATFLRAKAGTVQTANRAAFKPAQAAGFDVVLLDWPQSGSFGADRKYYSPLGDRSAWATPTVLLGSAGLNLAVAWEVRGGSG